MLPGSRLRLLLVSVDGADPVVVQSCRRRPLSTDHGVTYVLTLVSPVLLGPTIHEVCEADPFSGGDLRVSGYLRGAEGTARSENATGPVENLPPLGRGQPGLLTVGRHLVGAAGHGASLAL